MTITVNVLTTLGSDPDLYTFLGFIDGAGNDEDPVLNDTSTKFNAEVSLLDAVFITTGTGYTYDKFGRTLGTGTVATSTIVESGVSTIKYTHSTPIKLQDIINGIILYSSGNDPTNGFAPVGSPYSDATTGLLDNLYMNDIYVYTGNSGDDTFTSGWLDDKLDGKAGNDELHGNKGDDTIEGGAGDDLIDGGSQDFLGDWATYATATVAVTVDLSNLGAQNTGGAGTDTLMAIEHLLGSKFNDTLTGDGVDNFLEGGVGSDTLIGGGQNFVGDFAFYTKSAAAVTVDLTKLGNAQNTGGGGTDTLIDIEGATGSKFNDKITGNTGDNGLDGYFGNDILDGGLGFDTVYYIFALKGVQVDLNIAVAQNTIGLGIDTLTNIEGIFGSFFTDKLKGSSADNLLWGLDGNDTIEGRGGADKLDGGNGRDTISYASSAVGVTVDLNIQDNVTAQAGAGDENGDIIVGFEDIIGSTKNDILTGDSGNNAIDGGDGDDVMTGGFGNDFFRFSKNAFTDGDSITDFTQGDDKIDVALIDAKSNIFGNQRFTFIDTNAFSRLGQLRYEYDGINDVTLIQGNNSNTNGNLADFTITLSGNLTLTSSDFIL